MFPDPEMAVSSEGSFIYSTNIYRGHACARFPGEIALNEADPVTDPPGSVLKLYLIFQQAAIRPPKLPKTLSFALGRNCTRLIGSPGWTESSGWL